MGLADTYDLDDTVLYKNNPQVSSGYIFFEHPASNHNLSALYLVADQLGMHQHLPQPSPLRGIQTLPLRPAYQHHLCPRLDFLGDLDGLAYERPYRRT